ncbi:MAG: cytochrome c1, partial [Pseudomonadota bacterium]
SFRNLGQKGGPFYMEQCPPGAPESLDCSNPNDNPVVQKIAEDYKFQVTDGPDEYGDMFERAPSSSDKIPGPYPNKQLARVSNNGALPPDMSLLAKARHHGPDYIYSLLQGYKEVPDTVEVAPGQYYNEYYPGDMSLLVKEEYRDEEGHILKDVKVPYGGVFAMAQPIYDEQVDYADESVPETIAQYASDVSEFLMWAAEPKLEARKQLGMMSVIYLLILSGLLYWSYREIWSKDH